VYDERKVIRGGGEMKESDLISIELNLQQEDEYDSLCWGSKDTIRNLLKYVKSLKRKIRKLESTQSEPQTKEDGK